jgi:hypothetical protein
MKKYTYSFKVIFNDYEDDKVVINIDVDSKINNHCEYCVAMSEMKVIKKAERLLKNGLHERVVDEMEIVSAPTIKHRGLESEHIIKTK